MALTVPHIDELLQPGAETLGYELVAVELSGGDTSIVRVYIDAPNGVTVTDCSKASRQFSAILDVADPIKIKMATLVDGRRRFTGELIEATDEFVVVEVDGEQTQLLYDEMDRARLVPVYDFDV